MLLYVCIKSPCVGGEAHAAAQSSTADVDCIQLVCWHRCIAGQSAARRVFVVAERHVLLHKAAVQT